MRRAAAVTVIILILCIIPGLGCAAGLKNYTDSYNGFKLKYPSNWKVKPNPKSRNLIKADFSSPDNKAGFQVRIYDKVKTSFPRFRDWYANKFKSEMEGRWGGKLEKLSDGEKSMGRTRPYVFSYKFIRKDGQKWLFKHYLWKKGDRIYLFQGGAEWAARTTQEKHLDQAARTMEFTK